MESFTFKVEIFLTGCGRNPAEAWQDFLENIDIRDVLDQINSEKLPPVAEKIS